MQEVPKHRKIYYSKLCYGDHPTEFFPLLEEEALLRKSHFTTVGKGIPSHVTTHCEVGCDCMYVDFYHGRAYLIISYLMCYLSQRLV